jgi:hypothetical protein
LVPAGFDVFGLEGFGEFHGGKLATEKRQLYRLEALSQRFPSLSSTVSRTISRILTSS